jgi:hypothetical protein
MGQVIGQLLKWILLLFVVKLVIIVAFLALATQL